MEKTVEHVSAVDLILFILRFFSVWEQDRDGVIAAVEDARAAQEREADKLRQILEGNGKLSPSPSGANGVTGVANGTSGDAERVDGGYRDELAVSAEVCYVVADCRSRKSRR